MNAKRMILAGGLCFATVLFMSPSSLVADDSTKDVPVTYTNSNVVPGPGDPDNPEFLMSIPTGIHFTDKRKEVDASIEIMPVTEGGAMPDKDVSVSVTSLNKYKLKNDTKTVSYSLVYGANTMSEDSKEIGILNGGKSVPVTKLEGKGILGYVEIGSAIKGYYNDSLTYTISVK